MKDMQRDKRIRSGRLDFLLTGDAFELIADKLTLKEVARLSVLNRGINHRVRDYLRVLTYRDFRQKRKSEKLAARAPKVSKVTRLVLPYLPVATLKCLSKALYQSLVANPKFVQSHLVQARKRQQIMLATSTSMSLHMSSPSYGLQRDGKAIPKASLPWAAQSAVLRPINGLFCFVDRKRHLSRVYNLATREDSGWKPTSMPIQEEGATCVPTYGFGFDPSSGDYKILTVWEISRNAHGYGMMVGKVDYVCEVFTLGDEKFRLIQEEPPLMLHGHPVYANGSIYWRNRGHHFCEAPDKECIVAFDVGAEKFRVFMIPSCIPVVDSSSTRPAVDLLQVDGHIAIMERVEEKLMKLWISNDHCSKGRNSLTVTTWTEETIRLPFTWKSGHYLHVAAVEGTKNLILKTPNPSAETSPTDTVRFFIYDRVTKMGRYVNVEGIDPPLNPPFLYGLFAFHESLVPTKDAQK